MTISDALAVIIISAEIISKILTILKPKTKTTPFTRRNNPSIKIKLLGIMEYLCYCRIAQDFESYMEVWAVLTEPYGIVWTWSYCKPNHSLIFNSMGFSIYPNY